MKREEIFQYVKEQYGTEPEYLWKKDPDSAVLRHKNGKYKSTAKCMVEICSLFGFDSVNIFKYYMLKDRNIDPITNEYVFNYDTRFYDNTDNPVSIKSQIIQLTNSNISSFIID